MESCLDKKIEEVEVTNQFSLDKVNFYDKVGILDVKARINNRDVVNIEMQRNKQNYYIQRILLYAGGLLRDQVNIGNAYRNMQNVIQINILDFVLFNNIDQIHTIWKLREDSNL